MPARDSLDTILEKIRAARNFDFTNYKRATLERRVERRMGDRRAKTFEDYAALLDREPQEYDALVASMLIKVTSFFRDADTWDVLAKQVLPEIVAQHAAGEEIRVWTAGCATGEEAYSVGMMLAELVGGDGSGPPVRVFGTDVDEAAVAVARRGVYGRAQVEGVSPERLARWFTATPEGFAVRKEIRRMVVFGVNNLVSDAPISRLDLLLCRNVFIYLDASLQKRVLTRFHYALRPNGVLVLGKSELIPFAAKVFSALDLHTRVYRRVRAPGRAVVDEDRLLGLIEQEAVARAVKQSSDELSALREFHRDALDSLPLPVIATDLDGAVTLWNGAAARLWRRPAEEVVHRRLTALGLPGLRAELLLDESAAVRAGKAPARVAESELSVPGADPRLLRIEVTPLVSAANELIGLLYVVHDATSVRSLDEELRTARAERGRAVEDLQTANEELQSSNEELETTNEELQSANEELQTTNEELQSINEELETTNEELHSANAELDATNRELAHRTEELNLLGFYQRTIIRSLSSAVAVLDPQGRITLWNLAAERLFGITEPEALGQLFWTLRLPIVHRGLVARIRRSLTKQVALRVDELSYERPGGAQAHAALAAVPLVEAGRYLGAVILVEDTTRAVLLAEERIASARRRDQRRAGAPREAPRRGGKLVKLQIPREPK